MEERTIAAVCTGRYLLSRPSGDAGAPLLVGCHGYGENARGHLEQLDRIPGAETWVRCAVEALHPFYNTKTGEVVGCWMTSRDRELAIEDNVGYVARVIAAVRREVACSDVLVLAGFSQGTAMAYRAAIRSGFRCRGLIILAGDVPPELQGDGHHPFPPVLLGRGSADAWYSDEKMRRDLEVLAARGAAVTTCVFEGGHEWGRDFVDAAGAFLKGLAGAR